MERAMILEIMVWILLLWIALTSLIGHLVLWIVAADRYREWSSARRQWREYKALLEKRPQLE
jgi:hypothetical protein